MKIPGLDAAMDQLGVLQNVMIPLLERIADGVDELVELQRAQAGVDTEE